MRTASLRPSVCCLLAALACAAPLAAQSITGSIQGVVVDNQGLVVPAATVTARNVDTNVIRTIVTDAEGIYRFLNLPVGNYELTVDYQIFSRYVRPGLPSRSTNAVVDGRSDRRADRSGAGHR